jgi:hypothetical protein
MDKNENAEVKAESRSHRLIWQFTCKDEHEVLTGKDHHFINKFNIVENFAFKRWMQHEIIKVCKSNQKLNVDLKSLIIFQSHIN